MGLYGVSVCVCVAPRVDSVGVDVFMVRACIVGVSAYCNWSAWILLFAFTVYGVSLYIMLVTSLNIYFTSSAFNRHAWRFLQYNIIYLSEVLRNKLAINTCAIGFYYTALFVYKIKPIWFMTFLHFACFGKILLKAADHRDLLRLGTDHR